MSSRTLADYRRKLDAVCTRSSDSALKALKRWMAANPSAEIADIRNAAIEIANAALSRYGDASSSLACQLFDETMAAEGVNVASAQAVASPRFGAVNGTVRRVVGELDGSDESALQFIDAVARLVNDETRRVASETVSGNVERASRTYVGRNVRFARIPTTATPCKWCAMAAGHGFYYASAESAGNLSHHNCKCTIVPGVKNKTQVEGYDSDYYAGLYYDQDYERKRLAAYKQQPSSDAD